MQMKVLAIAGSPRRHGNSETLLDWFLESIGGEEGVQIEKIPIVEANVNPCRGCNACEVLNRCVQRDGMDALHDKLVEADCIVIAAPIFCMGINAQTKALIDRAQVFRSRKYVLKLPIVPEERKGKRMGVFLSSAGQKWDYVFDAAIPSIKCFYHVLEVRDRDIRYLMVNGVDRKGEIEEHPTAKSDAYRLGKNIYADMKGRLAG
ncbi:MAG: flavodoxin family protein [Methanomicrobiales archaeon]|nr:flavodoxin family protein [Methanomicrobiales archaeon]